MKAFENLKYPQLKALLDAANSTKDRHVDVVQRRHQRSSDNYEAACAFLKELKIIQERDGKITVKKAFQLSADGRAGDEALKSLLLKELLATKGEMRNDVSDYLNKYKPTRGSFEYNPTNAARVKESPMRNFLMDLELVQYNKTTGTYRIKEDHFDAFLVFLQQKKLTPEELAVILKRKEELGKAAELEVLEYEKRRLTGHPQLIKNIEHVAKNDVGAGFDILSWEKESRKGKPVERYIEVKAVSIENRNFYWSRNEVEKAKEMKNQYHLYLLPVISKRNFDIGNLEIIPNPILNVLENLEVWSMQVDTYLLSKAHN